MICRERKIIFVHIPKTGGTSIEDTLWPKPRKESDLWMGFVRPGFNKYQSGGLQHLTVNQIRLEVGEDTFRSCYTFALVRDPVNRLISQYNYLNKRKDLLDLLAMGRDRSFSRYLSRIREVEHVQWKPQADFICGSDQEVIPDIFRLEDINTTFQTLAARIGLNGRTPPHSKRTLPEKIPSDWFTISRDRINSEELDIIRDIYKTDYRVLGYSL